MKKYLAILMVLVIGVLAGCGNTKIPEGITENEYKAIQRIIEVHDEFLDAKITSEEFREKLETLEDRLNSDTDIINSVGIYVSSSITASFKTGEVPYFEENRISDIEENRDEIQKIINDED